MAKPFRKTKHKWKYTTGRWNEIKVAPRTWKFTYFQTKTRGKPAPRGSGMPIGSKLHWKINADQYAVKTGKDKYRLIMRGTKKQSRYSTRKGGKLHK